MKPITITARTKKEFLDLKCLIKTLDLNYTETKLTPLHSRSLPHITFSQNNTLQNTIYFRNRFKCTTFAPD